MHLFNRPHYTSGITQFLDELKAQHPELEAQQREGRALLWDKPVNREAWQDFRAARVAQQAYVYQTDTSK